MQQEWPGKTRVLDVTCGIGTQSIGLAAQGYEVKASDLSTEEVERAKREAKQFGVAVDFSVCDVRKARTHHGTGFDLVLSADNSLPHLLTQQDLLLALTEMFECLAPGGGVLITVRDYQSEPRGKNIVKPYGARTDGGKRYLLFQVWDFEDEQYELAFFFIEEDIVSGSVETKVMRSRYYAISTEALCELMRQVGFQDVRRLDGVFYQPVLIGTKPYNTSLDVDSQASRST